MTDRDVFERGLEERLRAYAGLSIPPVDADAIAAAVVGRARSAGLTWPSTRNGAAGLVWLLALVGLVSLAALVAGSLLRVEAAPDRPLLFSTRLGGLYVADAVGKQGLAIASDHRYADPRWSPDGQTIAVLHGNPASLEELPAAELLLLRPTGEVVGRIDGPIRAFAWVGSVETGFAVAAIRQSDRNIVVVRSDGRQIVDLRASAFPAPPSALTALPPTDDDPGGLLVSAARSLVAVTDLESGGRVGRTVATVPDGQINAPIVSPDGAGLVYLHASCDRSCLGEVVLHAMADGRARTIAGRVHADLAPSWTRSGDAVVVWPNVIPVIGGPPTAFNGDARIRNLDIGRWWTRAAPDGRGVWFFRQFPGHDDRRWELWAIDAPAAAPRRLLKDITGADLRP